MQTQSGTGQSDASPTTCFSVTADDGTSRQMIVDSRGTQHFFRTSVASDVAILSMRELDGTLIWMLNAQGLLEHVSHSADDPTHVNAGSAPPGVADSFAVGDNSYVGSQALL